MTQKILVADIGGTHARFAMASVEQGKISVQNAQTLQTKDFKNLGEAAGAYIETVEAKPDRACLAGAGPVLGNQIEFTNSHWRLNAEDIKAALALCEVRIVNDFWALAAGVAYLPEGSFVDVKPGRSEPKAPTLVIGPGTGLGQALIVPTNNGRRVISTEGGHITFAPRTDEEYELMKFIAREHSRVSVERLLSGNGLVNIYRALCAIENKPPASAQADEITAAAVGGGDPLAKKAVGMFCAILGRVAGDAVLSTGARGGVVLGGGILPKIREIFLASKFVERFLDKGRMRDYVDAAPVKLITREGAALFGAAAVLTETDL
jgi:glucokinase